MKNISIFILILFLVACSAERDFSYTKINVVYEPMLVEYVGKVHFSVNFPHNGNYEQYETFIVTDSLCISIYGQYNIEEGTKAYIIYETINDRKTATFYWECQKQTYKIIRN